MSGITATRSSSAACRLGATRRTTGWEWCREQGAATSSFALRGATARASGRISIPVFRPLTGRRSCCGWSSSGSTRPSSARGHGRSARKSRRVGRSMSATPAVRSRRAGRSGCECVTRTRHRRTPSRSGATGQPRSRTPPPSPATAFSGRSRAAGETPTPEGGGRSSDRRGTGPTSPGAERRPSAPAARRGHICRASPSRTSPSSEARPPNVPVEQLRRLCSRALFARV